MNVLRSIVQCLFSPKLNKVYGGPIEVKHVKLNIFHYKMMMNEILAAIRTILYGEMGRSNSFIGTYNQYIFYFF